MSRDGPFTEGFFDRADPGADDAFYRSTRLVTHIDDRAIEAAAGFYGELGTAGVVLDLMSSWVSHLPARPQHLTVLGMNRAELEANPAAHEVVVHDLNLEPRLPFADASFDAAVCTVSVDYLVQPVPVFSDVARVLRPGAAFACTFSNRCFPTKAIRGWLEADDEGHCDIVVSYFAHSGAFDEPTVETLVAPGCGSDPLYAVWARSLA